MTKTLDEQYINVLQTLVDGYHKNGKQEDRTGVGVHKLFGNMIQVDISESFPILLSRRVPFKSLVAEFLFFLNGFTNNSWLEERGCKFWNGFQHPETKELGPVYGSQLRNFNGEGYDQLYYLIDGLINRPNSRRHMFTYFNPLVMPDESLSHKENIEDGKAVLPPCHLLYQFNIRGEYLDGLLFQRSADFCIGSPSNIAQTAIWIYALSLVTGYKPGVLTYMTGDTHIYSNHLAGANDQIKAFSAMSEFNYPKLEISGISKCQTADEAISILEQLKVEDFKLLGYNSDVKIKYDIAI